jgi:transcription-repair coupling factor (superfamily II helicase)
MELKFQARALRIQEIDARREAIRVRFGPEPPVSPETIVTLLRTERGRLKYLPEDTLEYRTDGTTPEARLAAARKLLHRLTADVTVPR